MRFKRIIAFVLLAVLALGLTGCEFYEEMKVKASLYKIWKIDLWNAELIESYEIIHDEDTELFYKFKVSDEFCEELYVDFSWMTCPLYNGIYTSYALELYNDDNFLIHPETGEKTIPWVTNGVFKNWSDHKLECIIAVLDMDTNTFYYYERSGKPAPEDPWGDYPKGI